MKILFFIESISIQIYFLIKRLNKSTNLWNKSQIIRIILLNTSFLIPEDFHPSSNSSSIYRNIFNPLSSFNHIDDHQINCNFDEENYLVDDDQWTPMDLTSNIYSNIQKRSLSFFMISMYCFLRSLFDDQVRWFEEISHAIETNRVFSNWISKTFTVNYQFTFVPSNEKPLNIQWTILVEPFLRREVVEQKYFDIKDQRNTRSNTALVQSQLTTKNGKEKSLQIVQYRWRSQFSITHQNKQWNFTNKYDQNIRVFAERCQKPELKGVIVIHQLDHVR